MRRHADRVIDVDEVVRVVPVYSQVILVYFRLDTARISESHRPLIILARDLKKALLPVRPA